MITYDRFSIRARAVMARANEFVQRYGHHRIDTEHMLLALIEQVRSPVPVVLGMLKVDVNGMIDRVILTLRASPRSGMAGSKLDKYLVTDRAVRIIDQALAEAAGLDDRFVLPEHLLLAMFSEVDAPAAQLLENSGLTRERFRDKLLELRSHAADDFSGEDG